MRTTGRLYLAVIVVAVSAGGCDLEQQARQTGMDAEVDRLVAQTKVDAEAWAAAQAAVTARATMPAVTTLSPVEPMAPLVTSGPNTEVARTLAAVRCQFTEERGLITRVVCLEAPTALTCEGVLSVARAGLFKEPVMVQLLSMSKSDVFVEPDSEGTFAHRCNGLYETTTGRRLGPMPPKG